MTTAEHVEHPSLAAALAAFQADLPSVGKNKTANTGTYSYSYADLADVAKAGHPVLSRHGLSFSAKPTLNDEGKFVLDYRLRHESGGEDGGEFPLPSGGNMQAIGGAITYARRYAFCAITGIVADEDADGRETGEVRTESPRRGRGGQNGRQNDAGPARSGKAPERSPADAARATLRAAAERNEWDLGRIAAVFEQQYGAALRETASAEDITAFTRALVGDPAHVLAGAS